ncbi:unnamed protein product, partial [Vitis vinifera]
MVGRDSVNDHHKWDEVVSAECNPDFSIPASTLAPLGVRSRALPRLRSNPSHRSLRIGEYRFRPQMRRPLYRRWRQPNSSEYIYSKHPAKCFPFSSTDFAMYGHNPPGHRPTAAGGGSGRGGAVPPLQALPPTPNYFIQNVNPYFQNPTFQANLGLPYLQNPTLPTQNPTLPMQNTNLPLQNPNLPMQNTSFPLQNPSFAIQNTNFTGFRPQPPKRNKEALDRVDGAVVKARRDVIATGESVSAWKVSQSALLALQVDSWESLGFPMQEVPSLHSLIVIEGKINSFIHCFVGVRRITSLYDLEMAICKNEGVEQFEDLELGPLVRHPLIMHYFSISSDASGVFKITSAEIISCLDEFMEACQDKHIIIEEFLEYIAKKRSLTGRERLGVRIQSLGMHISFIREARKLEHMTLKKSQGSLKQIPDKKIREHPLRSSEKKKLDERFSAMSQRVKSFASAHDDFGGKHTIFVSSCSEEDGSDDHKYEESEEDIDGCSNSKFSSPNSKTRDRVSSCPYPSAIEEMTRLGLKGETEGNPSASGSSMHSENTGPFKRKRKSSNRSCTVSKYLKLPKRNKLELEACQEHTIAEVLERMLQFHGTQTKQRKIMKSMLSSYPFVGLLNVAVTSIKSGMWDSIYDTFQAISQDELTNKLPDKHSEYESIDGPSTGVTVEDVMRNLVTFFELDHDISHSGKSPLEKKFLLFRQLSNCEFWVAEKFSVKEFKSLGFGDFFTFLEKHASILPNELHKCLTSDTYEKSPLEVCMLQKQLVVLLSQASNSLWENETLTKQKISMLLKRQFPSVGFKILENGCMDDFLDIVREQKSCVVSTCVLFSSTLLGTYTIKDSSLLCLVTKDGKVMRIDHSATMDSFLEASLQGSSFRTAVQLLSLFSLFGGKRHVPFSLLKCHARQAFEVILRNSVENMEVNETVPVASRFLLDCLGYLPSEFRSFAADILLSGLQPFTINGPSAILDECNQMDQRVMLHEVGLSLGVMQWIDDYHAFSSAAATNSFVSSGALCLQAASSELRRGTKFTQNALAKFPSCEGEMIISDGACGHNEEHSEICQTTGSEGVSVDRSGHGCILYAPELNEHKDATLVIESIRRDEFGLDPTLSSMESSMLKKQHARLGRALHCLSQELYSQDSHFLLELVMVLLVQNADDNIYPENVEPTLTFILQDRGIIVLNNEQGFSAQNIRALCDVGNSTKKGSKAGYIGQKGIGFKSVFRVTDAPEIHSNGFHVKFDISEGQIGFVLPTVIPPCNVDLMKLSKGTGMSNIISMFSDLHPSLLLFLHHLRCIKFKNMLNDSLIIMRKEIVGDGIIKVSHGREKMTWFVISQKLRADVIRPDVQTTEIAIAFTLQESDNGEYSPHFEQQPVFAFLPLRTYGLKFILQGDFVLPSSREEVDGDRKAVAAYMSFVPLVGEVHGFFSSLPRMIISKLRMSNCLLLEGDNNEWVPPCKVLRSWNEQARSLLPDSLLCKHLGLGFLDKNIHLSDPLARALGIQEYGPKILLQIISSLCHTEDGLKSMGLAWLSSWEKNLMIEYLSFVMVHLQSSCTNCRWRGFFQALGVTDFVQIVQVEKNVSDISHMILKNEMWDRDLISHGTIAKDWESPELNLLDVLDTLWDDCFSDKVSGYCNFKSSGDRKPFKSSLMTSICDFQWIASSMDDELHYPKDLFYDSDEVHLVLGSSAPYALPKVRSGKLACDIGFKTKVTLDDILGILQEWRRSETPFKASIAQMSKFYTFIWNETGTSSQKIAKEFLSGPFIFVPCASGSRHEDVVSGMLLSVEDVYWHDSTGSVDRMKEILPQCDSVGVVDHPLSKMLCNVYPGHHDFFVNGCGVHESPSLHSYIEILVQLSAVALPSQAANAVFRVFLKWTEGLKSKTLSSEDIVYLKECLLKLEFTVLPTVQDKWVSLHPSFGLVCWCDDEKLRKEFKHSDNLDFLYFGNLSDDEKERLQAKVSVLMQTLGIPSLSEVITQEAIYYGPTDSSFKASLVNWALPYAQRYIYKRHPKKYRQFKQSGFGTLNRLRVVVVEKLFYRNIIKRCESASKKRFEASCLLQDNILYTTQESDSHSVFMELSRLLFDGTPELHLANFLHMITTMAESGSNEEQTEFFILNSQKVPKLPDEESVWSLSSLISQAENEAPSSNASTMIDEQSTSKTKEKSRPSSSWQKRDNNDFEGTSTQVDRMVSMEINANWSTEDDSAPSTAALLLPESETMEYQFDQTSNYMASEHVNLAPVTDSPGSSLSKFSRRDQLITGIPNAQQAMLTGRLGELVAFNYLSGKVGDTAVKWVNQESETGLPYDIVIGEKETSREFIEVKATKSARKDWFIISTREWQFAVEKGDSFSIAHVVLSGNNAARITMFKNPVKLCQLGQLQLAVMIPRQQKEVSVA